MHSVWYRLVKQTEDQKQSRRQTNAVGTIKQRVRKCKGVRQLAHLLYIGLFRKSCCTPRQHDKQRYTSTWHQYCCRLTPWLAHTQDTTFQRLSGVQLIVQWVPSSWHHTAAILGKYAEASKRYYALSYWKCLWVIFVVLCVRVPSQNGGRHA